MINLLSGEFYKLRKSRAFYICCLVAVFLTALVYGMLFLADFVQRGKVANGTAGVYVSVAEDKGELQEEASGRLLEEIGIMEVLQQMISNSASIVMVVFAAIFVIGEYGTGAIKNIVGKGYRREKIFLAKYIVTMAAGLVLLAVTVTATVLAGAVIMQIAGIKQDWSGAFFVDLVQYCGVQCLLGAAIVGVVAAISEICRNMAAGIAIGIGLLSGLSGLLVNALDFFVRWLFPQSTFRIGDYWILNLMAECPLWDIKASYALHASLVGMAWIILMAGAGILHFKRADIK